MLHRLKSQGKVGDFSVRLLPPEDHGGFTNDSLMSFRQIMPRAKCASVIRI